MNLRDRLREIDAPRPAKPRAEEKPPSGACWHRRIIRPPEDFPGAFSLRADTLRLMHPDPLPGQPLAGEDLPDPAVTGQIQPQAQESTRRKRADRWKEDWSE